VYNTHYKKPAADHTVVWFGWGSRRLDHSSVEQPSAPLHKRRQPDTAHLHTITETYTNITNLSCILQCLMQQKGHIFSLLQQFTKFALGPELHWIQTFWFRRIWIYTGSWDAGCRQIQNRTGSTKSTRYLAGSGYRSGAHTFWTS